MISAEVEETNELGLPIGLTGLQPEDWTHLKEDPWSSSLCVKICSFSAVAEPYSSNMEVDGDSFCMSLADGMVADEDETVHGTRLHCEFASDCLQVSRTSHAYHVALSLCELWDFCYVAACGAQIGSRHACADIQHTVNLHMLITCTGPDDMCMIEMQSTGDLSSCSVSVLEVLMVCIGPACIPLARNLSHLQCILHWSFRKVCF